MAEIDGVRIPGLGVGGSPSRPGFSALETARRIAAGASARSAAAGDSVELTAPSAPADAGQRVSGRGGPFAEIDAILAALREQVEFVLGNPGLSQAERQAIQAQIDDSLDQIDRIGAANRLEREPFFGGFATLRLDDFSPTASRIRVYEADLEPGQSLGIDVAVTQSAQVGSLFVNFGRAALDLESAGSQFVIRVAGANGAVDLAFASGASVASIVDAINSFTQQTGVAASVTLASAGLGAGAGAGGLGGGAAGLTASRAATSFALRSIGAGAQSFASVQVVDDGGVAGPSAGIFRAQPANAFARDEASRVSFTDAGAAVLDAGQDIGGTINGVLATGRGYELYVDGDGFAASVDVSAAGDPVGALRPGKFRAALLTGEPLGGVPTPGSSPFGVTVPYRQDLFTWSLGAVRAFDGAFPSGSLSQLRSNGSYNVLGSNLDDALRSIDRARLEVARLSVVDSARASEGSIEQPAADPIAIAADARRELLSKSAKTILDALGGGPRSERFG